jgi:hypothetical protein
VCAHDPVEQRPRPLSKTEEIHGKSLIAYDALDPPMKPRHHVRSLHTGLIVAALFALAVVPPGAATAQTAIPSGHTDYRTLADYESEMHALAAAHPGLVDIFELPNVTAEGRKTYGLEITHHVDDPGAATDAKGVQLGKPVFAVVGLHHGNEWASSELSLEFAISLVQGDGVVPEITQLLDEVSVVVVPVLNPDGLANNTRQNGNAVDINRNYGLGWRPDSAGGSGPFSEPESRNMEWLFSTRQIVTAVTMHTCINVVLYPPLQHVAGLTEDHARFERLAADMAGDMGSEYRTSADDYETTGEMIDWTYYATRGLNFTIETCTEGNEDDTFQTMVIDEWPGVLEAFMTGLRHASDEREHATITGTAPSGAVLTLSKKFDLWTSPLVDVPSPLPDTGQERVPTYLETSLPVSNTSGAFSWETNPSRRPVPAYREDGIHTGPSGFYDEPWTLTCAKSDGTVLQTSEVFVDLGGSVAVDLQECRRAFGKGTKVAPVPKQVCKGKAVTLRGTLGDDHLRGTGKADVIVTGEGNDIVAGRSGDDVICAGSGNDQLKGNAGSDLLFGQQGRDMLNGGAGQDACHGGVRTRKCEDGPSGGTGISPN